MAIHFVATERRRDARASQHIDPYHGTIGGYERGRQRVVDRTGTRSRTQSNRQTPVGQIVGDPERRLKLVGRVGRLFGGYGHGTSEQVARGRDPHRVGRGCEHPHIISRRSHSNMRYVHTHLERWRGFTEVAHIARRVRCRARACVLVRLARGRTRH